MALVIDLKPGEKILIGNAVITNDSQRTKLNISGDAAIMREKDVMKEEEADTPAKRVYFLIQCMYMAEDPKVYHAKYFEMVKEIQQASPTSSFLFMQINEHIISDKYYRALKVAKDLIAHEEELIEKALNE